MNTLSKTVVKAIHVWFDKDMRYVRLNDGMEVGVPVVWFPRLRDTSPAQREQWRLIGDGVSIHWENPDEDISVRGTFGMRNNTKDC